jgi:adenylate cyclase
MWVHFGPHDPARYVSAADFIEDRVAADRVRGKIVLVGTSATGLLDIKTTPIDPGMPGVEVHAQLLESMLSKSVLSASSYGTLTEIAIAAGISLAIIAFAPMISAWTLFLLGSVAATAIVALSWYYFTQQHLLIDFTFPLGSTFATYSTVVFTNYLRAHNERRQIRSAFSQYLSPALVAQLAESPEKLVLGGEERTMTFLFSDVRGFTTISETYKHDPHGLTQLMNRLLTPLTNVIIERKGTIDKYMGDAIMAFWNAPLTDADHELNACDAALAMLVALDDLNRQRRAEAETSGLPFVALKVGVGLNTGSCVVGNMGSDLHFNYSVLGDAVNLASRLESQSKEYGVSIVIGSRTATAVRDRFGTVELDLLQVKGKTEPEPVHTILGRLDSPARASMDRLMSLNAAMLAAYRSREWGSCLETILQCRELSREFGLDDFYSIYTQRVRRLSEAPPEPSWNGVWIAERK